MKHKLENGEIMGLDEIRTGIPQGYSLGPMLANIIMKPIHDKYPGLISYMDDGLIFS
jgi:hypothetical protein